MQDGLKHGCCNLVNRRRRIDNHMRLRPRRRLLQEMDDMEQGVLEPWRGGMVRPLDAVQSAGHAWRERSFETA